MFYDTETTGINKQVDRIIQFGAIYWSYDPVKKIFYEERVINQYIHPWETKISPEAQNAHGLNWDFVAQFDTMDKYIKEFVAYMLKADVGIQKIEYKNNETKIKLWIDQETAVSISQIVKELWNCLLWLVAPSDQETFTFERN